MKQNLFNKLWLRVGMIVAIMTTALSGTAWAEEVTLAPGTNGSACKVNNKAGIKVGTSSKGGDMSITVPANTTTLHLHAAAWKGVSGLSLNISGATANPTSISLTADDGISNNSPFTLNGNESDFEFSIALSNITQETTLTFTSSIAKRFVVWDASADVAGGSTLTESNLALTGAPVDLSFDLYNNSAAQTVSYTTSSTGAVTVSESDYVTTSVDATNKIITVTPKTTVTPSTQTITVSQEADATYAAGSKTFTVTITDSTPFSGGDVTFVAGTDKGSTSSTGADNMSKRVVTISSTSAAFATAEYRIYSGSETTVSVPDNYYITQIVFTDAEENDHHCSNLNRKNGTAGTYNQETNTWTGASKTVVFVAGAQARASEITVTVASGEIPPTPTTYNVTFDAGDGTFVANTDFPNTSNDVEEGTYTLPSATRDGYTFDGWLTTGSTNPVTGEYTVSEDVAFTAQYTQNGGDSGEGEGTINFSNKVGDTAINSENVTGEDNNENTWTITTEGTTSFTANSAYYQVGSGSNPATSITFTTTLPEEVKVTAMSAKFGGFNGTAGTITLKVGNTTIGTGSLNGTNDVTVESTSTAEGSVLTVTVTGIAKGVKCYYISYTYEAASSGVATETTITIPSNFNSDIHNGTSAGTLTATVTAEGNAISGAAITWTSSDTDVATIDANGAVTLVAVGTTIITASYAGVEDQYRPSSESYELTVIDSYSPGTANNPYTVTEALEVIGALVDGGKTETEVYTTGIISQIDEISTSFGNATYWISVDGTTTNQMEVYRGKYLDNANFTDESQIQVGDKVIVYGKLQKYVKDEVTTPEIAQGNYIVSQAKSVSVTAAGYATYCSENALDFTGTDITAYVGTIDGTHLTFTPITQVPANTGLLLKAEGGATVDVPVIASAPALTITNCLTGTNEAITLDEDDYILNVVNGKAGFYRATTQFTALAAHRAYISAEAGQGVKSFIFDDDDATAISSVESFTEEGAIYNVAGQRLQKMQKGINIVNGKKILK